MDREPIPGETPQSPDDPEPLADEIRELQSERTGETPTRPDEEMIPLAPLGSERAERAGRTKRRHLTEMFGKLGHRQPKSPGRSRKKS